MSHEEQGKDKPNGTMRLEPVGDMLCFGRADDKQYHEDLYWNVLTYMHGCGYGVAIVDRIEEDEFSPNVAFEIGYMKGLNKNVCILKDKNLKELPADLLGKLYKPFDPQNPENTIRESLSEWLSDHRIGTSISLVDRHFSLDVRSQPISVEELLPEQVAILQSRSPKISNVKLYRDADGRVIVKYDES